MDATRTGTVIRLGAGAAIALATAAVIVGGVARGAGTHVVTAAPITVAPAAADSVLTCPGPLLALGRNAHDAGGLSVAATERVTSGADGAHVTTAALRLASLAAGGPARLTTPATGHVAPQAAAAASTVVDAADLAGFTAAPCTPALMQSWLVGGATDAGSSDLVLLANPGPVAATVDLTLYGTAGETAPAAGSDIVVAPGAQVVVPLAALGLAQSTPVVRVTSSGAPVRAALQTNIQRTLIPGGVDQTAAIAAAGPTQVIPGVRVTASSSDQPTTVLRVLAPREATAAAVQVTGDHGTVGPVRRFTLPAGQPAEIALTGLAAGTYTVTVSARHSVIGAVWQATGTGAGDDFAWVDSAPVLPASTAGTLFAVPTGPDPVLAVSTTATTAVTVHVDGTAITVRPGTAVTVPVRAGSVHRLTATGPVVGAVTFAGAGALASFPVWEQDAASAPVVVHR